MYVCASVCNFLGKLWIFVAQKSFWQISNYTRNKNNKRLLLNPFSSKVMTICIQTWEDSWKQQEHLNINAKQWIESNIIDVVLATTSSTASKHFCQESYFLLSSSIYFQFMRCVCHSCALPKTSPTIARLWEDIWA